MDGPFKEEEKDITLAFRGSRNQRLIDMKKSLKEQEASLWIELCMFKIEHIFYPLLRKFDIMNP